MRRKLETSGREENIHFRRGGTGGRVRVGEREQSLSVLCQLPSVCQSTSQKLLGLCPHLHYQPAVCRTPTITQAHDLHTFDYILSACANTHAQTRIRTHLSTRSLSQDGWLCGHKWNHHMHAGIIICCSVFSTMYLSLFYLNIVSGCQGKKNNNSCLPIVF